MKKIIIIGITLLFLTGCGMTDEEKENMLYNSLEKAFTAIYVSDGVGLAVHQPEVHDTLKIDGEDWYLVSISKYDKVSKLTSLAEDVYTEKLSKKINKIINKKYREANGGLYTKSEGGCHLSYQLDDEILEKIKADVEIKKIKMNKIIFEYKGKEYTAKKSNDNYVFDEKIFECKTIE